jgi:hypothetical protein
MIKKSTVKRLVGSAIFSVALIAVSGHFEEVSAQRDPFEKPAWARTRDPRTVVAGTGSKAAGSTPVSYGTPAIDQRIDYYKRLRENAVANGLPMPKVTSVLTLDELAVTGIFKTPRGYAAIVEATPIKLSYTIYPGDKFFNGQLVAVEENRLVFRKVDKIGKDKFTSSVENKSLRKFTDRDMIQGTAPAGAETASKSDAPTNAQALLPDGSKAAPVQVVSPLSELDSQPTKTAGEKPAAKGKKPVKVARKKN